MLPTVGFSNFIFIFRIRNLIRLLGRRRVNFKTQILESRDLISLTDTYTSIRHLLYQNKIILHEPSKLLVSPRHMSHMEC